MLATAAASSGLAPSPYTVSVGSATRPPERRIAAALSRVARASAVARPAGSTKRRRVFTFLIFAFLEATAPPGIYSQGMTAVETEIKFRVQDVEGLAPRLSAAGFHLDTPRTFESNVLYDTPDRQMRARTEILRIRSYNGRCLLTHKRPPDVGPSEDTHKHRIETETEI